MSNPPSKPAATKAPPAPAKPPSGKPADAAALPDAALLDRDGEDGGETVLAPIAKTGIRRFLPSSALGWTVAASILLVTLGGSTAAALLFSFETKPAATPSISGPARALDGRTLVVAGQVIHLQDIEAPPATLVCRDGIWEYKCGDDSRKALEQIVANGVIDCTPGTAGGTLVGRCRSEQNVDVASAMVEAGWAVADLHHSSRYFPQQAKAQNEARGLWRNNFAYPEQWRLAARSENR